MKEKHQKATNSVVGLGIISTHHRHRHRRRRRWSFVLIFFLSHFVCTIFVSYLSVSFLSHFCAARWCGGDHPNTLRWREEVYDFNCCLITFYFFTCRITSHCRYVLGSFFFGRTRNGKNEFKNDCFAHNFVDSIANVLFHSRGRRVSTAFHLISKISIAQVGGQLVIVASLIYSVSILCAHCNWQFERGASGECSKCADDETRCTWHK